MEDKSYNGIDDRLYRSDAGYATADLVVKFDTKHDNSNSYIAPEVSFKTDASFPTIVSNFTGINNSSVILKGVLRNFAKVMGLQEKLNDLLDYVKRGNIITCNDIGKRINIYISKNINLARIKMVLLEVLPYPYAQTFINMTDKSFLSAILTLIQQALYTPSKDLILPPINDFLENFKERFKDKNVFATKFISYIQTLINAMYKSYSGKLENVNVQKDFAVILHYLPGHMKSRFINIMRKTITGLRSWKYDITLTPLQNIRRFTNMLKTAGFHNLLLFNIEDIMIKNFFQNVKFPGMVKYAVLEFVKNSNYKQLFTRLTKFVLVKYGVPKSDTQITKLMDSQSFNEYAQKVINLINSQVCAGSLKGKSCENYVRLYKLEELFAQVKIMLKKFGIPDAGLKLLDELFSKIEINKFSLKDLPALLVADKVQIILKKFIIHLQKSNIYDILMNTLKTEMPTLIAKVDELVKLVDGKGEFNEVLLAAFKVITNSMKFILEPGQMVDFKSISNSIEKLLSNEEFFLKLKNTLLYFYDNAVSRIRITSSKSNELKRTIRSYLVDINVKSLRDNTSLSLLTVGKKIVNKLTQYFEAEFKDVLQDKLAKLPNIIMENVLNKEKIEDYDM